MRHFRVFSALLAILVFTNVSLARESGQFISSCDRYLSPQTEAYEGNAVGRAIDTFLSWFGIGQAPAARSRGIEVTVEELAGSPMAQNMVILAKAGALLNQSDKRLNQFQLLVANGGLCVSTSVTNSLAATCDPNPETFEKVAPFLLAILVKVYPMLMDQDPLLKNLNLPPPAPGENILTTLTRPLMQVLLERLKDARYGAISASIFLKPFESYFKDRDVHFDFDQPATIENLTKASEKNSLMILTAAIRDRRNGATAAVHGRHAMVLLKYLVETNEVVISDPNRPNQIFKEKLQVDNQGNLFFRLRVNYTNSGSNAYLDQIQVISGPSVETPAVRDYGPSAVPASVIQGETRF